MSIDVLIVDDSVAVRKILLRVLAQAEIRVGRVFEAGDGVQALAALKDNKVDLILSDINMPNMDGLQFLSHVRAQEQWKSVPFLMITTEGSMTKVSEAVELGASGYVRKPFTAEQIRDKLSALI